MIIIMEAKEKYLQTVWKYLHGPRKDRKAFLQELRTNVEYYLSEKPDAEYSDLETNFGRPEDLGKEFSDSLESQAMERSLRMRKTTCIFVGVVAVTILIIVIGYLITDYIKMEHFRNGRWIETIYMDGTPPLNLPEGTVVYID